MGSTIIEKKLSQDEADGSPISGNTRDILQSTSRPVPIRLERESSSVKLLVALCLSLIILDMTRQLCCYAMKYYNNDIFPVPSTFLVFTSESLKLILVSVKMLYSESLCGSPLSFAYIVPSTLYALNNNIYFLALYLTTPPVWNILMQSRIVFTALVYRGYFKKAVTVVQWFGLVLLTLAIVVLQFSGSDGLSSAGSFSWNIVVAFGLATVASGLSAVGPVYTEYLFKHDKRSFDEKQFQIYLFGSVVTGSIFWLNAYSSTLQAAPMSPDSGHQALMTSLICVYVFSAVVGGIMVAVIIKKLDNIVKLYTQAISSALTAFGCVVLFPRAFQFDFMFIVSFVLTLMAIYLYEVKTWPFKLPSRMNEKTSE